MKIAIFGDSFGAKKDDDPFPSWVNLLGTRYHVDNYCQCGVSEYKILQQVKNTNLTLYDQIIITHTSPYRVFVKHHPVHTDSLYHTNCDILFTDIESRNDEFSVACKLYFKHIFDESYACDIHNLICFEIEKQVPNKTIHVTHFDYSGLYSFNNSLINFYSTWKKHKGTVNHYNEKGNQYIFNKLVSILS